MDRSPCLPTAASGGQDRQHPQHRFQVGGTLVESFFSPRTEPPMPSVNTWMPRSPPSNWPVHPHGEHVARCSAGGARGRGMVRGVVDDANAPIRLFTPDQRRYRSLRPQRIPRTAAPQYAIRTTLTRWRSAASPVPTTGPFGQHRERREHAHHPRSRRGRPVLPGMDRPARCLHRCGGGRRNRSDRHLARALS